MVNFVMQAGIENLKVTKKNYGKFLDYFKPRINLLCKPYALRYNLDASEVRETFYDSVMHAIKEWKQGKKRKTLNFEKWYWWVANQRIINWTLHEAKEREKRAIYHDHLQHALKASRGSVLDIFIDIENVKLLIKDAENYSGEFKELLEYIKAFMLKNYSRAKIMSCTIKALSKKHGLSKETVYQSYRKLLQFMIDECEKNRMVILKKSKPRVRKFQDITCGGCGERKYIRIKDALKLVIKYGNLEELKYNYRCKKCEPVGYYPIKSDSQKGDTPCLSSTSSESQYCSDSSLQ